MTVAPYQDEAGEAGGGKSCSLIGYIEKILSFIYKKVGKLKEF